jgi:hypothetical protein
MFLKATKAKNAAQCICCRAAIEITARIFIDLDSKRMNGYHTFCKTCGEILFTEQRDDLTLVEARRIVTVKELRTVANLCRKVADEDAVAIAPHKDKLKHAMALIEEVIDADDAEANKPRKPGERHPMHIGNHLRVAKKALTEIIEGDK